MIFNSKILLIINILYSGKTYATVGSHSGFIFTFGLEKEYHNPVFEIKLPDRIESSVLILDNFRGIVGKFLMYIKIILYIIYIMYIKIIHIVILSFFFYRML